MRLQTRFPNCRICSSGISGRRLSFVTNDVLPVFVGLDTFNPSTMDAESIEGKDVPAWFLDSAYNELSFHVTQAFFPRTGAWDNLKRALRATHEESVWDHLNGTTSAPFEAAPDAKIALKVIDTRGNELMVVKTVSEAITQE